MQKQQPSPFFEDHLSYIGREDEQDLESTANDGASSDDYSSPPDSPRQSFAGSAQPSYVHIPQWPQSYRQSMDIYSSLTSPSLSIISPSISHISSSHLLSSLRKRSFSRGVSSTLIKPILPTKEERVPSTASSIPKYPTVKVPDVHKIQHGCSAGQAILNGMNVLCGVGILSTPAAVKEGGWLGLILFLIFAVICCYTGLLLKYCLESEPGLATYPDIGQAAFGSFGRIFISVILYTELYALCVEFLILEGDNLSALYPNVDLKHYGVSLKANELFTILTALFVLPTVWLQDLTLLSYLSAGGVIASVLVVLSLFWIGAVNKVGFYHSGPLLDLANLPVSIGLYAFCYSGHAVFPNIYSSLKKSSEFPTVLVISFLICTTMFGSVAVMGFTMFGEETLSQITLNLPKQYVASKITVWTTVVNPFTKYALTMTPVALSLEELLPTSHHSFKSYWWSVLIRTLLVVSTLCVSLIIPFFGLVMAFIGSFLSMLVCLIVPAVCFLKIAGNKATWLQRICCVLIITIGTACSVVGTYSSLSKIAKSLFDY